jgi:ketosteroid isomerase-like protein
VERILAIFASSLDADVTLSQAGGRSDGTLFRGREQVLAAVEQARQFLDFTGIEVERIGVRDDSVVVFLHTRWRTGAFAGRGVRPPADTPMAQVWRFRQGRIVEIRPFSFEEPTIPLT